MASVPAQTSEVFKTSKVLKCGLAPRRGWPL